MTPSSVTTSSVVSATLRPYALAYTHPVVSAQGRFTHRRGWLLGLTDDAGRTGWGDAAPWPGFGSSEERVARELGGLSDGRLEGLPVGAALDIASDVAARKLAPEVAHGLELALLDLLGQRRELPLWRLLSAEGRATVRTHALLTGGAPDLAQRWFKVKVGAEPWDADEARLARAVAALPPDARLRVDVGGGWTVATAERAIPRLARLRVHTVEQPIAPGQIEALVRLRALANEHGLRLSVDEELTGDAALGELIAAAAVDEVVVKPMFVGGLLSALQLAKRARAAGVGVIVTHALESAIGRAGAIHLAATLDGVHGLANALAEDVASLPNAHGGALAVPTGAGLGVAPSSPAPSSVRALRALPNPLASSAMARPDHPALVTSHQSVSYRELALDAAKGAHQLRARGVTPSMVVALTGPRDARWVTWLAAIGWLGAAAAPLPHDVPVDERARLLAALRPDVHLDSRELPSLDDAPPAEERDWPLDEARLVLTTSGSTGAPRRVTLDTLQLTTSAFGSALRLGHELGDRWLACLPLHHVGGLSVLFRCMLYGTTVVLHERFDAAHVAAAIDGGEVSLVSLVPTMLARVLDEREARHGAAVPFPMSLRAILLGGAAAPDELLARAEAIGAPVALSWGMTEAASQIATTFVGQKRLVALPFARVSEHAERLAVRGRMVAAPLITSDAGHVAADGSITVYGRADDVIVSGGEKVSPAEIQGVLCRHPHVDDAAVIARDSERWGRRPYAVVETHADLDGDALRSWCREHLAAFKVPDGIVCLPALPRRALGKVALSEVRQILDARFAEEEPRPLNERHSR